MQKRGLFSTFKNDIHSLEINLTSDEKELFDMLLKVSAYSRKGTTVRVAGNIDISFSPQLIVSLIIIP